MYSHDLLHHRPPAGGVSLRRAVPLRLFVAGLSLFTLIAASTARVAIAQPTPDSPANALALLQWCWQNRDITHYHQLFADNYQYYFDGGNPAGLPYLMTPWSRTDELASAANLFSGGSTLAPASSATFTFVDGPNFQATEGNVGYPWHQEFVAKWTLDITCTDGSALHGEGLSKWIMVRGDSAQIPQELKDQGFTPDPNRWYIERWLELGNTAPIVMAPSTVTAQTFMPVTIGVTAWDPDIQPISSLTANFGTFSPSLDRSSGMFTWTPLPTDVGPRPVMFIASNDETGSATTMINVLSSNAPPVASLSLNTTSGRAPLGVVADASGSHDPDGHIVSYRFDFGDGMVIGPQTNPIASHSYTKVGTWPVTLTVTDNVGATGTASSSVNVTSPGPLVLFVITPNTGVAPLNVFADGSGSTSSDTIATYRFDFGDGTVVGPQAGATATHTYNVGSWTATLQITDKKGVSASTTARVTVAASSLPVAALTLSPNSGVAPLTVIADASQSTATGGRIASYLFTFGDGIGAGPQASPTAMHTYGPGNWTATVKVTDAYGASASATATVSVGTGSDPTSSLPNIVTNPSFESGTAGWEPFYGSTIAVVAGGYDGLYALQMTGTTALDYGFGVNDHPDWVHRTTVTGRTYRYTAWVRSASSSGTARIRVREYFLATGALVGQISSPGVRLSPSWQELMVDYTNVSTGSSLDLQVKDNPIVANEVFLTDLIGIRDITGVPGVRAAEGAPDPDGDVTPNLSFRATLFPSPVQTSAALTFATTRIGALHVDLVDLAGRVIRHLDDEAAAPAGMHSIQIGRTGDDGQRMSPGLYFYRIVADEGHMTGRFVLLR